MLLELDRKRHGGRCCPLAAIAGTHSRQCAMAGACLLKLFSLKKSDPLTSKIGTRFLSSKASYLSDEAHSSSQAAPRQHTIHHHARSFHDRRSGLCRRRPCLGVPRPSVSQRNAACGAQREKPRAYSQVAQSRTILSTRFGILVSLLLLRLRLRPAPSSEQGAGYCLV